MRAPAPTNAQTTLYSLTLGGEGKHVLAHDSTLPFQCACGEWSPKSIREKAEGVQHEYAFDWFLRHVTEVLADNLVEENKLTPDGRDEFIRLVADPEDIGLGRVLEAVYTNPRFTGPEAPPGPYVQTDETGSDASSWPTADPMDPSPF